MLENLNCLRCGHAKESHDSSVHAPCNHSDVSMGHKINCICYAYMSPLDSRFVRRIAYHETTGLSRKTACALAFVEIAFENRKA